MVAYFGWVDTELVRGFLDRQEACRRLQETLPGFLLKRITPEEAGAALVRGIEQRAPRVFAPRAPWRDTLALRGLINPIFDWRMETDPKIAKVIREAEAAARR